MPKGDHKKGKKNKAHLNKKSVFDHEKKRGEEDNKEEVEGFWGHFCFGMKNVFFSSSGRILKNVNVSKREFESYDVPRMPDEFNIKRVNEAMKEIVEAHKAKVESGKEKELPLWRLYLRLEYKSFRSAFFLRLSSDLLLILLPFFIRQYEKSFSLKSVDNRMDSVRAIVWVAIVTISFFVMYMMRQHAEKYTTIAKLRIEQGIKSRLFNKLLSADYISILNADSNTMSKILLFGLDNVLNMSTILPSLFAAPFALVLGCYFISILHSNFFFTVAIILYLIFIIFIIDRFNSSSAKKQSEYDDVLSLKSIKIEEFFDNITMIQTNSLGDSLKIRFDTIGKSANKILRKLHLTLGLAEVIITLSPFVFTAISTSLYHFANIGPETNGQFIRFMVCAFAPMVIHIKVITESIYKYRLFKVSYQQIIQFMGSLRTKGETKGKDVNRKGNRNLAISLSNCFFMKDDHTKMKFENLLCPEKSEFGKTPKFLLFRDRFNQETLQAEISLTEDSRKRQEKLKETFQSLQAKNPLSSGGENSANYCLKNITMEAKIGEKVCILGDENSGKHDLFLAIMRELIEDGGRFHIKGTAVYLDMNNARLSREQIKENILLGRKIEKKIYMDLIELVGLRLTKYPLKDRTVIVEGQKNIAENDVARILLARLLYSTADIYMLNNFFDQLNKDKQISTFKKIVLEYLQDKTVIYATNLVHLVKMADRVIVMRDGRIVENNKYEVLIKDRQSQMYRYLMTDPAGNTNLFRKVLDHFRITIKKKDDNSKKMVMEDEEIKDTNTKKQDPVVNQKPPLSPDRKLGQFSSMVQSANPTPEMADISNFGASAVAQVLAPLVPRTPPPEIKINEIDVENADEDRLENLEEPSKLRDLGKLQRDIMYKNSLAKRLTAVGESWTKYLLYLLSFLLTNVIMLCSILVISTWGEPAFDLLQTYDQYITTYDAMSAVYLAYVVCRDLLFTKHIVNSLDHLYNLVMNCLIDTQKEYLMNTTSTGITYLLTKTIANIDREYIRSYYKYLDSLIIILCILGALNYFLYIFMSIMSVFLMIVVSPVFSTYQNGCIKLTAFTTKFSSELIEIFLSSFNFILPLRNHRKII